MLRVGKSVSKHFSNKYKTSTIEKISEYITTNEDLKKLFDTQKSLEKIENLLIMDSNSPSWRSLVLLVGKAGGVDLKSPNLDANSIRKKQKLVGNMADAFRTTILFHKSLEFHESNETINKIKLLIGDYLMAKTSKMSYEMNNQDVQEIMYSALRDLSEASFFGERDENNEPLPSKQYNKQEIPLTLDCYIDRYYDFEKYLGNPKAEWILRTTLEGASTLGKGCLSAVKLGGNNEYLQKKSFSFGVYLALALEAKTELISINNGCLRKVSAPVLFHLQHDKNFDINNISNELLKHEITKGPGIQKTRELLDELRQKAFICLRSFPQNEAKWNLHKILMNFQ